MTAEKDKSQEIDPRIRAVCIPIGRKGLAHIIDALKEKGFLDEDGNPMGGITKNGLTLMVDNFAEGLQISLSQTEIKVKSTVEAFDEINLIEKIGRSFEGIDIEQTETGVDIKFLHPGCPIKKIPLTFNPDILDKGSIGKRIVDLRKITITGIDLNSETNFNPQVHH